MGLQQAAGGIDKAGWPDRRLAGGDGGRSVENQRRGEALAGFPGVERVAFVRQQQRELFRRVVEVEVNRRREIAQQGGRRLGGDVVEDEGLRGGGQVQQALAAGDQLALFGEQRDADRDQVGCFVAGARVGLRAGQRLGFGFRIEIAVDRNMWRTGLVVPAHELREVKTRSGGSLRRRNPRRSRPGRHDGGSIRPCPCGNRRGRSASGSCG